MRLLLTILLLTNPQDTDIVKVQPGIYVMVNGSDSVTIITSKSDTVFTNEILIAQSNNNSAVIKKKVKWVLPVQGGYVDNYGVKVDLIKWKNPKNNRWIDP